MTQGLLIPGGLPRKWYDKLKELKAALGMNDRQMFILGLWAVCHIGDPNGVNRPGVINRAALDIREEYPSRNSKADRVLFSKPVAGPEPANDEPAS